MMCELKSDENDKKAFWKKIELALRSKKINFEEWVSFADGFYDERNDLYCGQSDFLIAQSSNEYGAKTTYQDFTELVACAPIIKELGLLYSMCSIPGCEAFDAQIHGGWYNY